MSWARLLLCCLWALWSVPAVAGERRFALLVGANAGSPPNADLLFAEQDAQRMAQVLTSLGGVHPADLVLLQGPSAGQMLRGLDTLEARLDGLDPGIEATVFVYYSGHADAFDLQLGPERIPMQQVRDRVEALKARLGILIVDACRSGELVRRKGAIQAEPFRIVLDDRSNSAGLAVLTAASAGEDAAESDRLRGGVFTHHLLAGLRGAADRSGDLRVTLDEAYRYAYDRTLLASSSTTTVQHPGYAFDLAGRRDVFLTRVDGGPGGGTLWLERGGEWIVFDQRGRQVITELSTGAGARVALPAGEYLVRRLDGQGAWQARLAVPAGGEARADAASLRRVPAGQVALRGAGDAPDPVWTVGVGATARAPFMDGLAGAVGPGLGMGLRWGHWMLRADGGWAQHASANRFVSVEHGLGLASLSVLSMWDLGPVSLGPGLRLGGAHVVQRFDARAGLADRRGWVGTTGGMLRAELTPHPRWSVGLHGAGELWLLHAEDPWTHTAETQSPFVAHATLEVLSRWH